MPGVMYWSADLLNAQKPHQSYWSEVSPGPQAPYELSYIPVLYGRVPCAHKAIYGDTGCPLSSCIITEKAF